MTSRSLDISIQDRCEILDRNRPKVSNAKMSVLNEILTDILQITASLILAHWKAMVWKRKMVDMDVE